MTAVSRFGRFDLQVRVVLFLLVVFLGVVALMNLFLLGWARDEIDAAARSRAEASAERLAEGLRPAIGDGRDPPMAHLRRWATRTGFREVRIVDPRSGRSTTGSRPGSGESSIERLPPSARAALDTGRRVCLRVEGPAGAGGTYLVFQPVLAADGTLDAILEARQDAPNLARLDRWIARLRTIQILGLLVVAAVVVGFANWVSRPYRTLAAVAGEAGLTEREVADADPEALAGAFRTMVGRMREQDRALGAIEVRAGSLGDLVRFARGPAAGMGTGVVVLDRRRRVAALNAAAENLLRAERAAAEGAALERVAPAVPGLGRLVSACLDHGEAATREVLRAQWPDGRTTHLGVTLSPALGPDGAPTGALLLMTDLTEIRDLQERARVRANLATVGEAAAGIAHEIRNALATILANARLVEKRDDALARGPAAAIVREVEEANRVIEQFLAYARPSPPRPERFDLRGAIVRSAAAAPETVEVEVEGEFGTVVADRALVLRVFDNLLRNAAEADPERGTAVRVTVRGRPVSDGRWTQVEVEDDGPGIPDADLDRVFAPFFTSHARGTGLGLPTARRTMSDLGGSIEAARAAGGGALFRLRFPRSEAPRTATAGGRDV